jgi:hypothetical protein
LFWILARELKATDETGLTAKFVMPGLVPGIHVLQASSKKDVDGRDKPGHDESESRLRVRKINA